MADGDSPRPVSPDIATGYPTVQAQTVARIADLESVLGVMSDGVAVYDRTGHITYLNPALRTFAALGVRPGHERLSLLERAAIFHFRTLDGQPLADDQVPQVRVLRGEALGREGEAPEYVVTLLDGRTATIQFTGSPLRDETGAITGAVLVFRDVTDQRRLERAKQHLAAQLEATFDAMADLVLLYDDTGRLLRINRAMREVLGIMDSADYAARTLAARGQPFTIRTLDGELLPPAEYPIARALRGELPTAAHPQELLITDAHGHERALSFTGSPVRDEATGTLLGYVTVGHDISERRRLEHDRAEALVASETWFHTLADTAPVLVWVSGVDGLVTFVNLPWLRFTGRSLEQELGDGWAEGVHPDDYDDCMQTYRTAFQARQPFTMEYRLRRADGEYRRLLDTGMPRYAPDGTFLGYIGSVMDISERRQLEGEREEAQASELALREVNERLDVFAAMAAHDLRQPVTATKLRLEVAQRQVLQAAAKVRDAAAQQALPFIQVAHALEMAQHDLDRLWRLMQQLLDVARARQGSLVLDRQLCDLAAIVRAAVEEQSALTPERAIALTLALPAGPQSSSGQPVLIPDPPPVSVIVDADEYRLSQVLTNYLANAVRYSPDDQPIEVAVRIVEQVVEEAPENAGGAARAAQVARVEVSDHGLGIAPEEQATIWDRFQRARSGREIKGGLGLGLYIARTIVELHGGRVGVESTLGAGSTFWFTLPLGPTAS